MSPGEDLTDVSLAVEVEALQDTHPLDSTAAGGSAVRGGGLRIGSYVAGIGLSLISTALLLRHLGSARVGNYVTILSLVALVGGFTDAGLQAIAVRELSHRPHSEARALLSDILGLRIFLTLLGLVAAVIFSAAVGYGSVLVAGTAVAGIALLLQIIQTTYSVPMMAELRLGRVAATEIIRQALTAAAIIALVLGGASLLPFYAAGIPAGIIATAVAAALIRGRYSLRPVVSWSAWRPILIDTAPYALATAVGAFYFRVAIIVVSLIATAKQTGYFGTSFRVIDVLIVVPQLLVGAAFPIFARSAHNDRERFAYAVGRVFDVCLILGVGAALALAVGAPFIITVIAGPGFVPAEAVLRIQGIALSASFVGAVFGYSLLSLHRYRAVLVINIGALLLCGVLTTVLASADGARGAAIATTTVEILFTLALGVAVWRSGVAPQVSWSAVPRVLIAAAIALCSLLIPGARDVERLALTLVLYPAALILLRAIPAEVIQMVPARAQRFL